MKRLLLLLVAIASVATVEASEPRHEDHYLNALTENMNIRKRTTYYLDVMSIFATQERFLAFLETGSEMRAWVNDMTDRQEARYDRVKARWAKRHPLSQQRITDFLTQYMSFLRYGELTIEQEALIYHNILFELAEREDVEKFAVYLDRYNFWYDNQCDEEGRDEIDNAFYLWADNYPERDALLEEFMNNHIDEFYPDDVVEALPDFVIEALNSYLSELAICISEGDMQIVDIVFQNIERLTDCYNRNSLSAAIDNWAEANPAEAEVISAFIEAEMAD